MKAALVFLSFLLLCICAHSNFFCSAAEEPDAVLDIDGKILRAGVEYYILPVRRGSGGGLTFSSFGNETCPLSVVQHPLEVERGHPVTFTPVNPKKGVIRVSTDLNFKFSAFTICIQSNVWKLDYDESIGKYIINTNGVEGNPGGETLDNWFKIERHERDYYKIVYCPTVCDYCKVICKDVGIFIQEDDSKKEMRRLALTDDEPFRVMFTKASSSASF